MPPHAVILGHLVQKGLNDPAESDYSHHEKNFDEEGHSIAFPLPLYQICQHSGQLDFGGLLALYRGCFGHFSIVGSIITFLSVMNPPFHIPEDLPENQDCVFKGLGRSKERVIGLMLSRR